MRLETDGNLNPYPFSGRVGSGLLMSDSERGEFYLTATDPGDLPRGLALDDSGVIRGTPKEQGMHSITIQATDRSAKVATRSFLLDVRP
jgi:hypothetical protein